MSLMSPSAEVIVAIIGLFIALPSAVVAILYRRKACFQRPPALLERPVQRPSSLDNVRVLSRASRFILNQKTSGGTQSRLNRQRLPVFRPRIPGVDEEMGWPLFIQSGPTGVERILGSCSRQAPFQRPYISDLIKDLRIMRLTGCDLDLSATAELID
ncbi:hypothetical protein HJFPF1_13222 [Paramyrothecium foliicola]|nr:hypothetical protein HJFPF1_13222 [Paramyrothecium foliicola]